MRPLIRRCRGDDGTAMVLVAIVLFSLLAMSALAVDVATLVQERRTLQNGADAAAQAVAQDCAGGACGAYGATAAGYADANADDGTATVEQVCGSSPLAPCADPPTVPTGARYVRVTTKTRMRDGSDEVPFTFARVMGFDGSTRRARATVAWGGPSALTSALPITISVCEWSKYTTSGTVYTAPPPYPPNPPASAERTLFFHDTTGATPCPQGPSGADLPGGFGWLKTTTDCQTPSSTTGLYDNSTGVPPPSGCDPAEMQALVGKVVLVPVYDNTNGLTGSNGQYHIKGYASFYLTGYFINGQYKEKSTITNGFPCSGSQRCISGFFVNGQLTTSPGAIGGPSMGAVVVAFAE
jgi:Flp pilus assembly protein TadG